MYTRRLFGVIAATVLAAISLLCHTQSARAQDLKAVAPVNGAEVVKAVLAHQSGVEISIDLDKSASLPSVIFSFEWRDERKGGPVVFVNEIELKNIGVTYEDQRIVVDSLLESGVPIRTTFSLESDTGNLLVQITDLEEVHSLRFGIGSDGNVADQAEVCLCWGNGTGCPAPDCNNPGTACPGNRYCEWREQMTPEIPAASATEIFGSVM